MNGAAWVSIALRAAMWGGIYVLMAAARYWWERWWMARWQGRRVRTPLLLPPLPMRGRGQIAAAALGLLAGAAVPLAPAVRVAGIEVPFYLVGGQVNALYPLIAIWGASVLLAATARPDRWGRQQADQTAARVLSGALPVMLAGLSLLIAAGWVDPNHDGTLNLAALVALQGGWAGSRWLGILQPLAAVLWAICARPVHPGAQARTGFGWQLVLLAHTLLTAAICWGGWQGPGVDRLPWLGLVYTTLKVAAVTLAWSWIETRLAEKSTAAWVYVSWPISVSLGVASLVLSGLVAAAR